MGFFSDTKDRLTESMALPMLNNSLLKPYGQATHLRLNSGEKSATITLDLKGESAPVEINIGKYELVPEADKVYLILHAVSTSREWLTTLVQDHLLKKKLELPSQAAAYAGKLL
jgi:hypothetical protein